MTTTKDQLIEAVNQNHIWINAFELLNPSDDLAKTLGYCIIRWLKEEDNLLPRYTCHSDMNDETMALAERLSELTPVLYMSVNAS